MNTLNNPKYFRSPEHHFIGWEIYNRHSWFLTFGIRNFEIQLNLWGRNS